MILNAVIQCLTMARLKKPAIRRIWRDKLHVIVFRGRLHEVQLHLWHCTAEAPEHCGGFVSAEGVKYRVSREADTAGEPRYTRYECIGGRTGQCSMEMSLNERLLLVRLSSSASFAHAWMGNNAACCARAAGQSRILIRVRSSESAKYSNFDNLTVLKNRDPCY